MDNTTIADASSAPIPTQPTAALDEAEVVELHWMKTPDVEMHQAYGIAAPALCGVWMEPDEPLATQATSGAPGVRLVSCTACDLLHAALS